jgi:chromosome segregation ATPase
MMKRTYAAAGIVATIFLLACAGCTRTTGRSLESNAEFRQIKASLDESLLQKAALEKDVEKLKGSLGEAESKLAEATTAKNGLQVQVQELTTSRSHLEAKVSDLDKARISVEAKVSELTKSRDDLQKMVQSLVDTRGVLEQQVATLTKAKNAALEDARNAQSKVDALNDKLKVQTQQMIDLQEQIKTIRTVLEQLQQKLE